MKNNIKKYLNKNLISLLFLKIKKNFKTFFNKN